MNLYDPEEAVRFKTITLEKAKVASMQMLGPQMAHDADVRFAEDLGRNLAFSLESYLMRHRDGTESQHVTGTTTVDVLPEKRPALITSAVYFGLGLATVPFFRGVGGGSDRDSLCGTVRLPLHPAAKSRR